ncbi:MAG: hypothetical protein E3J23_01960 [Candidatus Stahlbacteria bacterium]|nr:MAG: hypothetical protein E3J23_01960 [Candidatus Stahlbacteria bacterium]
MKILNKTEVLQQLCKTNKKYGMYISFSEDEDWAEIEKAAPYLTKDCDQILVDCEAWLLFDNGEEMHKYYDQTVGGDGPTKLNNYNGLAVVYALTCNPHGQLENENT